jgi:hypothetical protein
MALREAPAWRDMQKFGLLYMNGGAWRGHRLISDPANQAKLNALLEQVRTSHSVACPGGGARMIPSIAQKEKRLAFKPDARAESVSPAARNRDSVQPTVR